MTQQVDPVAVRDDRHAAKAGLHAMVLFEDDQIIAVDKPEGILSIPARNRNVPSLARLLSEQLDLRLYVVHRLDKEVSGVILLAKTPQAHRWLNEQFSARRVQKHYVALVLGAVPMNRGTIRSPIREFGSGRMGVDPRKGKASATSFEVRERLGPFTLLDVTPTTGRRHQIRVHLYSLNHPVVGDSRYGPREQQMRFPRLMLHASRIRFTSLSGTEVTVDSPLPPLFTWLLEWIRSEYCPREEADQGQLCVESSAEGDSPSLETDLR